MFATLCLLLALLAGGAAHAATGPRPDQKADLVVVYKAKRELQLLHHGRVIRRYDVALGRNPEGHKRMEGDGRTPEGVYQIDWRNPASNFHRALHVSYPLPRDLPSAARWGVSPGGLIMVHGLPNGFDRDYVGHPERDWTNGCIALTNDEIDEIWSLVDDGTTIIIYP
jgi:murein L,D-transpeptidase YafK